ncbi:hypothetical protein ACFL6S_11410 [Candidatus Poribacteria bacterium]
MMAKKRKKKRRRRQPQSKYGKLVHKMKEGGLLNEGQKVLYEPKGEVKMSAVILDFIEPYAKHAKTPEAYQSLIMIAIVAWNAALLSENKRKDMIDIPIKSLSGPDRKEMRKLLEGLVERKNKRFADYKRPIMDYQLTETKDGISLSVASSLITGEREPES